MYYFVLFKASWCGHCQNFQQSSLPAIKEYINKNKDFFNLVIYDADENSNVMSKEGIEGYPTIRLYGGNNRNLLQTQIIEFRQRDAEHIKRVLDGFKKKVGGKGKKVEHFTPQTKSISYSSYYTNYNGKENAGENEVVCKNGVCKRKSKIIDSNGKVKESNDVMPYNEYSGMKDFYDVSLELRNHF